jgi:hypothetical protein
MTQLARERDRERKYVETALLCGKIVSFLSGASPVEMWKLSLEKLNPTAIDNFLSIQLASLLVQKIFSLTKTFFALYKRT